MAVHLVHGDLVCTSPYLDVDVSDVRGPQRMSGKYDLSYEMMEFLYNYYRGVFPHNETNLRLFDIATRKGCYKPTLISDFGILSDAGKEAIEDAILLRMKILRGHVAAGVRLPEMTDIESMSELDMILPYATISVYCLRVLRHLWDLLNPTEKPSVYSFEGTPLTLPVLWRADFQRVGTTNYLLSGSVRHDAHARKALDTLYKLGLTTLTQMPRNGSEEFGRGRAPIGVSLSKVGIKVAELFLASFDPTFARNTDMTSRPTDDTPEGVSAYFSGVPFVSKRVVPDELTERARSSATHTNAATEQADQWHNADLGHDDDADVRTHQPSPVEADTHSRVDLDVNGVSSVSSVSGGMDDMDPINGENFRDL